MGLLAKPPSCVGCPLAQDMRGYVPDELVDGAEVTIVAQNPGNSEESGQKVVGYEGGRAVVEPHPHAPLIGATGYLMEKDYFPLAGLERGKVSLANVLRCRWIHNGRRTNNLPTGKVLEQAMAHCSVHDNIPSSTRLIIAMGALSWKKFGGPGTVSSWRGFLKPHD